MQIKDVAIKVETLSFSYQDSIVLENISFEIKQGEYVGLIGPNGGGKTTLLKLITGLTSPQKGKIRIHGVSPEKARRKGKIGYVPQRIVQANIQCPATVEEVVTSGRLSNIGIGGHFKKSDLKAIETAMLDTDVEKFRNRSIDNLSGGEKQRVFIARALASEPSILILDEPTTGVDIKATKNFYSLLKDLNQWHEMTIIIVSHDIEAVAKEVDSVLCLNRELVSTCKHEDMKHNSKEILNALYGSDKTIIHHHHDHA